MVLVAETVSFLFEARNNMFYTLQKFSLNSDSVYLTSYYPPV